MWKKRDICLDELMGWGPEPPAKALTPTPRTRAAAVWVNAPQVKRAREARGYTQEAMALKVGLARTQYAEAELTGRIPARHPDIVERLAAALGIDTTTLMTRYDRQRAAEGEG